MLQNRNRMNNYEEMRNRMRGHFLEFDQAEMIRKFSLRSDEDFLYIRFLGRDYRVGRRTGVAEWSADGFRTCTEGDYNESMTIYDVLCCSRTDCFLTDEFVPSNSLKGVVYTAMNTGGSMFAKSAEAFERGFAALPRACEALGGVPEGKGDVAYRIPMFDFLPVRFSFWQADEDFPPEIKLLWDRNVLSYMHYETLWFAAGHMMKRLREEMEIEA